MANNRADNPAFNQLYSPPAGFAPQFVNGPSTPGGIKMQSSIPQSSAPQSSGSNFLSSVGDFLSGALGSFPNPIGTAINAITGIVGGISQRKENERNRQFEMDMAQQEREWNEQMMDKQNQWNIDQWNRENAYNSPAAQLSRLRDAGMNPLFYGLDGNSANQLQSAQALGYDRASVGNQVNPFTVGMDAASSASQMGLQAKQNGLIDAQVDKLKAETSKTEREAIGIGLDNEWKEKTKAARIEAENLKVDISKETINQIQQNIKESIARTDSEKERKMLIIAERLFTDQNRQRIAELLPYEKLLMEAQTKAQKAQAAYYYALELHELSYTTPDKDGKTLMDYMREQAKESAAKTKSEAVIASNEEQLSNRKTDRRTGRKATIGPRLKEKMYNVADRLRESDKWFDNSVGAGVAEKLGDLLNFWDIEVCVSYIYDLADVLGPFISGLGAGFGAGVGKGLADSAMSSPRPKIGF